jgi:hypothetical protein
MYVLDRYQVLGRLTSASKTSREEQLHPWQSSCLDSFSFPLLRTWDSFSGSQPDEQKRMSSRAPNKRLDTSDSRRISLATHINHRDWTPTPYISFTSSPAAVEELAMQRRSKRGAQTLTVIGPNVRLRKGLPILNLYQEMEHYGISNPYGSWSRYCVDHYICLWQVTEEEIVGHWKWDELAVSENWFEDTVMPAFRDFDQKSKQRADNTDLSEIMDRLCRKSIDSTAIAQR